MAQTGPDNAALVTQTKRVDQFGGIKVAVTDADIVSVHLPDNRWAVLILMDERHCGDTGVWIGRTIADHSYTRSGLQKIKQRCGQFSLMIGNDAECLLHRVDRVWHGGCAVVITEGIQIVPDTCKSVTEFVIETARLELVRHRVNHSVIDTAHLLQQIIPTCHHGDVGAKHLVTTEDIKICTQ